MPVQTLTLPPHDEEAERIVLAGLMHAPDLVPGYLIDLEFTADALYFSHHRVVWDALWELIGCGCGTGPADVLLVLRGSGLAGELGGVVAAAVWLGDVWDADPTGWWAADAAARVLWMADRRADIRRANEVIADAVAGRIGPANYRALVRRPAKTM